MVLCFGSQMVPLRLHEVTQCQKTLRKAEDWFTLGSLCTGSSDTGFLNSVVSLLLADGNISHSNHTEESAMF